MSGEEKERVGFFFFRMNPEIKQEGRNEKKRTK